ncbi:proline dehydrogenase family protein [Streptomyces sp. NA02950]|uniref:proline dehydrogenase family protein n=1 Tax=Streptomyces sp. NA02950 TaxID=2742137 RepID=UPI00159277D2|nr:proline dehydrogenase family protein [Streptomyces sp. NA02950]QKV96940.1 proline dehydrogenase family protein [Streptomyces sp. NA02950]
MTQADVARPEDGDDLRPRVADVLRKLALDEQAKARIPTDPVLGPLVRRAARRYVAGETAADALTRIAEINRHGHRATVDYMGESCRDAERAGAVADAFVALSESLAAAGHDCSLSLDLSHIGLVVDPALALRHARRLAEATVAAGQEMMISMEGSDRTDAVLDVHGSLCEQFDHVGVTILARLHRTADDLPVLLSRPGRIRLVKGAFLEPETIAFPRGSRALRDAYLRCAGTLLDSDHLCSFATHDWDLLGELDRMLTGHPRTEDAPWEFETLLGLGPDRLTSMRAKGHPTREYVVYGTEWWLYVCNRIAEEPERLFRAVVDAAGG